jgi:hypothetical protein
LARTDRWLDWAAVRVSAEFHPRTARTALFCCHDWAVKLSRKGPGAAEILRRFVYGDVPLEQWGPPSPAEQSGEPWASFERARRLAQAGQSAEAVAIWRQIAMTDGVASRVALQAWHFVRQAGHNPPEELASVLLGAVAEVPVKASHDVLAAYRDGTARYLNHTGGAVIWEDRDPVIQAAIDDWLAYAQGLARALGAAWTEPSLPPLPPGHLRVLMLTPSGPRFGQGPEADIGKEPAVSRFLSPATALMQLLTSRHMDS